MNNKAFIMSAVWWVVSLFLLIFGIAGLQAVGLVSTVFLFIAIFVNPIFTKFLKKIFFFETTDKMKAIAILIGISVFILIKMHVIGLNPNAVSSTTETTTVFVQTSTTIK